MKPFRVDTAYGVGIREYRNLSEAKRVASADIGRENLESVRHATLDDIKWVAGMGGRLPKCAREILDASKESK